MKEIRWIAQCSKKYEGGYREWRDRPDVTYSGWFHCNDDESPSTNLLSDFAETKSVEHFLDWRLVQEVRTFERKVIA